MSDAGVIRYNELDSWAALEGLIAAGEAEGLHLEAKAPLEPRLTKDQKDYLAKATSGFANTAGGLIIWGMSTTKHAHSGLDILTQLEPLGSCRGFMQQVQRAIPTLTTPAILTASSKVIAQRSPDARGVVLTHIPYHDGEPVQSNADHVFYWRSGDEFRPAPYDVVQRLFSSVDTPELEPFLDAALVTRNADGGWTLPIGVQNNSSAVAEHVHVTVEIRNPGACDSISIPKFSDESAVNPGRRIFMQELRGVVHKHLNRVVGNLSVKMKVGKRPKRGLTIAVSLYANRMPARRFQYTVQLAKKGFSLKAAEPVPIT